MKSVFIVGAGISGLIIGDKLNGAGFDVQIVDKGNNIGGRLATKRIASDNGNDAVFDFGAQHFNTRDSRFGEYVNSWKERGIIDEWIRDANGPRYKVNGGMRTIASELSKELNVKSKTKIVSLESAADKWTIIDEFQNTYKSDIIILTAPVPQSLDLLSHSGVEIPSNIFTSLGKVSYFKCIAGLATLASTPNIEQQGYLENDSGAITWLADNFVKGISSELNKLTVHTSPKFSDEMWNCEKNEIKIKLTNEIQELLKIEVTEIHIHKWRYSLVERAYNKTFEFLELPLPLILAGDGFVGGRVEGAAISGIEAADYIIRKMS